MHTLLSQKHIALRMSGLGTHGLVERGGGVGERLLDGEGKLQWEREGW